MVLQSNRLERHPARTGKLIKLPPSVARLFTFVFEFGLIINIERVLF